MRVVDNPQLELVQALTNSSQIVRFVYPMAANPFLGHQFAAQRVAGQLRTALAGGLAAAQYANEAVTFANNVKDVVGSATQSPGNAVTPTKTPVNNDLSNPVVATPIDWYRKATSGKELTPIVGRRSFVPGVTPYKRQRNSYVYGPPVRQTNGFFTELSRRKRRYPKRIR